MSEPSADDYALVAAEAAEIAAPDLPYRPPMPRDRSAPIALVGAGGISGAHLDAYRKHGLNVVAIGSRDIQRATARRDAYFPAARVTDDYETLLADRDVQVLDITTHADVRAGLMRRALAAGKHVLSQKPFVTDLATGRELVAEADARGLKLAVNQNGRWAPHLAWLREAVRAGLIGAVTGVHVEIRWNHGWVAGTPFDEMDDLVLSDFGIHWFDFLVSVIGGRAREIRATTARAHGQGARPPLLAQALVAFDGGQASLVFDGATAFGARDSTSVIGDKGVVSSAGPDLGCQQVELSTAAGVARPRLEGTWFNDGFAGAMGELLCAIEDDREPNNSARGNLASLRLCLAAVRSAATGEVERLAGER
jgi:predicted dehydrogenase